MTRFEYFCKNRNSSHHVFAKNDWSFVTKNKT